MRGITGMGLQFRFLVVVLAAVLMVFGIMQLRHMPVDVLPEFLPPHVEIQSEALGLSAEEVEQLITVPLEQNLLNGVAWLDKIRSESVSGMSSVTLGFEAGTDIYRARQMVAERLVPAAAVLPRVSRGPVMLQPKSATSRVLVVRLSSKKLSAIQMSVLARWTITPRVMGVPGVANVATWGMRDRQLQVLVDPERLRAHNVTLLQVLESVGNALWVSTLSFVEAATPGNAGFIDTPQQRLGIQHISPIVSAESLARVSVQGTGMLLVNEGVVEQPTVPRHDGAAHLSDMGEVVEDHQPLIGDALAGDGACLLLVVEKLPGSDTVNVTRGVENALAAMRPGLGGMDIDSTVFRPATFVETGSGNLTLVVVVACLIAVLMAGLFFLDWRPALVCLAAIPLSLVAAVLVLYMRGATMNVMVLAGLVIAIGVIVDDAIVVVDAITRRLRHLRNQGGAEASRPTAGVIFETVLETRGAVLFAGMVCLLAMLPVLSLQQVAGTFFNPLAVSYALAVLASTVVAMLVTPALAAVVMPCVFDAPPDTSASPLVRGLQAGYERWLGRVIPRPLAACLALAVLMGIGLVMIPFLRPTLLPAFKERDLFVRLDAAPGTSHPEMVRVVGRAMRELRAMPGIRSVGALVGRAVCGDQTVGMNSADILVSIAPASDYGKTVSAVRTILSGYPGIDGDVRTCLERVGSHVAPRESTPIIVRVYGQDWTVLRGKAEELRQGLSGIAGVGDLKINLPVNEPTLEVEVDTAAAQLHGLNPGHVRRSASTFLNGIQVGSLFQEQKVFDVVVWSTPEIRGSLDAVRNLLLDTPFDIPVRLGDLARVSIVPRPSLIKHENVSRYVDIGVNVKGRSAGSVRDDIRKHLRQCRFPLEYHAEVIGAYERRQSAWNRLLVLGVVALIGIVLLLHAAFQSWRLAILSFAALSAGLAGGVAALAVAGVHGIPLGAVLGLITVFGVGARNQIMLISRCRQLEMEQGGAAGPGLVMRGARERFPSILMTALTIGLALLPPLLMGNVAGLELLRPTAIAILGGLVTSTLVSLLVVPVLYLRLAGAERDEGGRRNTEG